MKIKNEHDRMLVHAACHMVGIAPLGNVMAHDMNRVLSTISPEEARVMKRKFRKLWRKIAKERIRQSPGESMGKSMVMRSLGFHPQADSVSPPSRRQKLNRKLAVSEYIHKTMVGPMKRSAVS